MAKLVDALASGASDREIMEVRVLFAAPNQSAENKFASLPTPPK